MAGRTSYSDADLARLYVVLTTNEGNVKRTSRDTGIPESTVRQWKKKWEQEGPPKIDEEVEKAIVDYVGEMERTRDLALVRMHEKLERGEGTLPQIATVFGVLTDKIDRARGVADKTIDHRLQLPSAEEIRATLDAARQDLIAAHEHREDEVIDVDFEDVSVPELPRPMVEQATSTQP